MALICEFEPLPCEAEQPPSQQRNGLQRAFAVEEPEKKSDQRIRRNKATVNDEATLFIETDLK